jgi:two-component system sensor kinase FixL
LQRQGARALVAHYGIAVLAIAVAVAIRLALESVLEGSASHIFYMPAILIASAVGGWGPGIFATVLGLLAGVFFVADVRGVVGADIVNTLVFAMVGVGTSWRGELLRRARTDAAASAAAALSREAHSVTSRIESEEPNCSTLLRAGIAVDAASFGSSDAAEQT